MGEGFFRQTRRVFAGILCVLQENATRYDGKRTVQTAFEVVNTGSYFSAHERQLTHSGEAGGGKLGYYSIILSTGTATDQELPRLVPAHNHADV